MKEELGEETGVRSEELGEETEVKRPPSTSSPTNSYLLSPNSFPPNSSPPTLRFANFRAGGRRNRCEPCTCRNRSHFFFLENGDAYNVDTGGTIWYQAAGSFEWKPRYRCRNYIPWSTGIGRLDHVMRDEQGFPGSESIRISRRIPCGRPDSGGFIGFQTDAGSCVVFLNGNIVYEGAYRSDCDAEL